MTSQPTSIQHRRKARRAPLCGEVYPIKLGPKAYAALLVRIKLSQGGSPVSPGQINHRPQPQPSEYDLPVRQNRNQMCKARYPRAALQLADVAAENRGDYARANCASGMLRTQALLSPVPMRSLSQLPAMSAHRALTHAVPRPSAKQCSHLNKNEPP